ncbi:glutathione S-transferase family protein [Hyphomonas johnsonii]|uniref:Glutathione S-transferase domain-containing protein n=1 Tax=Hyphomonas johnsonii MHS-2 TaxID=1280950 RepID=A0A059FFY9_9PROT|nr:glutathione S-transferase family protein [Hyphomonas johnsonii]KCZ89443.1 glutathione S-transferase domain-containing protein [Hyphomonas johnsonii MHS-2]
MKLYTSIGPNPHVVRMYLAERGITLPIQELDLMGGENRQEGFLAVNPAGQSPALEMDDGTILTEIWPICEYLDETHPGDTLFGSTPEERAQTRRWTRWVDLNVVEPLANGFRFSEGLPMFKDRMRCLPEAAPGLKACAQDKLAFLDSQMASRDYVAGDTFTFADIMLYCFLVFGNEVGQPLNPAFRNLTAWFERVGARPSASA